MKRVMVVFTVCSLLSVVNLQAACLLRGTQYLETGSQFAAMTAADFNHDGFSDIAVTGPETGVVRIFKNEGNAIFAILDEKTLQNHPHSIQSGDYDGDAIPDLAVAGRGSVAILQNKDGKFAVAQRINVSGIAAIAAGDFNSDSLSDLAVLTRSGSSGTVSIFLNANGSFHKSQTFAVKSPGDLISAHLGSGQAPDLLLSNSRGAIIIFRGSAAGEFQELAPVNAIPGAMHIVAGSINGDALTDLVVTGDNGELAILIAQNETEFTRKRLSTPSEITGIALADFNHDQRNDLLLIQSGGRVAIYSGNGQGSFVPARSFLFGFFSGSVLAADLNHDGNSDFVAAEAGSAGVFLGSGQNTFATGAKTIAKEGGNILAGDFDADGFPDLIISRSIGSSFLRGRGNATFDSPIPADLPLLGYATASDLNGDGKDDLVGFDKLTLKVWFSSREGHFREAIEMKFPVDPPIQTLDLNGDGLKDIALLMSGQLIIFLNQGGEEFDRPKRLGLSGYRGRLDDFNGDQVPDLATIEWRNANFLKIYLGAPGLKFTSHAEFPLDTCAGAITTGDTNGDGKIDIAIGSSCKGFVQLLTGDGFGNFSAPLNVPAGTGSADPILADLNADGAQEILAVAKVPAKVSVSVAPEFSNYSIFGPHFWDKIALADFNRDGSLDVVASSFDSTALFLGCSQ